MYDLGERLQKIKTYFDKTNDDIAAIGGVTGETISKIIRGASQNPSVNMLVRISEELKVNLLWLLKGKGEMLEEEGNNYTIREEKNEVAEQNTAYEKSELSGLKKKLQELEKELAQEKRISAAQEKTIKLLEEKINKPTQASQQSA